MAEWALIIRLAIEIVRTIRIVVPSILDYLRNR